jgi:alpha-galactosidase
MPQDMGKPRIVIVGAGGYVFPLRLSIDILSFPELQSAQLVLFDISEESLKRTYDRVKRVVANNKLPAKVEMTTNRRKALKGADYVIVAFQVGGVDAYKHDVEIPRKYGLDQCVGDTLGPGGVFRGLRSIGALKEIARDMLDLCPDALMLQYANPMAMNCWATSSLGIKTVGLCHSVQGTSAMLIKRAGYNREEVSFKCGGINHQAWFTRFVDKDGNDIYPAIRETMLRQNPSPLEVDKSGKTAAKKYVQTGMDHDVDDDVYYYERVRTEIMRTFGYFHTESSHHGSEYTPWFRKNAATINAYIRKRWDYYVISSGRQTPEQQRHLEEMINGPLKRSEEYGSLIIHSMETDQKRVIYGNVPNDGMPGSKGALAISNLSANACVEVACLVDRNGIQPTAHGALPAQCAAVNRTNINVQELAVMGALSGDRDAVHHAIAMDPLTGALLTLPAIRSMVNDMFAAERAWLPQFV